MPLQDLNMLLLEPLLCCLGHVFWVIVMLEYPSTTHFQCPGWLQWPGPWRYMDPSFVPLMWCSPVPLAEKHPQNIIFPPPFFTMGMVNLGSWAPFLLLQTWRVELMPKILVSSNHNTFTQFSSESLENFRWAWPCAFLSRGTLRVWVKVHGSSNLILEGLAPTCLNTPAWKIQVLHT